MNRSKFLNPKFSKQTKLKCLLFFCKKWRISNTQNWILCVVNGLTTNLQLVSYILRAPSFNKILLINLYYSHLPDVLWLMIINFICILIISQNQTIMCNVSSITELDSLLSSRLMFRFGHFTKLDFLESSWLTSKYVYFNKSSQTLCLIILISAYQPTKLMNVTTPKKSLVA